MSQNTNTSVQESPEVIQDFNTTYSDKVHVIGRSTMVIAFFLSFLPILFLYFVMGFQLPASTYIAAAASIASMFVGMWIAEPFTWFPVIGAASLYMSYFAGNTKNIRVPVARSVQNIYNVEITTPKGQIITTIAVAVSVYVNLLLLLVVVLLGNWFIPMLPAVVLDAFNYVIPSLIGALLSFRVSKYGVLKTLRWIVPGVLIFILVQTGIAPILGRFGTTSSIAVTILIAYIVYRVNGAREDRAEQK
ncbi:hypothetical protein B5G43_01880 [Flavonifractor sp. An92]|uniref:hypothetical protein n=1 Tax=Flavonifractor sp. An92 TaxID=1965666 RepID=UPI000B381EAC|nr:hypothetical protein [Flavonifractor sp. An92]OUN08156.1 hypothetical protein B5G43_01880 [Flavonifractor sp. An92]